jgi:magnesium transporter
LITVIQYNDPGYNTKANLSPSEAYNLVKVSFVNWLDVEITNKALVEETANLFEIHHLMAEDILNIDHLPKFELFGKYLFFSTKMLSWDEANHRILKEHLSVVLGPNLIITFQEGLPGDDFDELRERIALSKGVIRKYAVDYLFYLILDAVVDHYMQIMEHIRMRIEFLERQALSDTGLDVMPMVMDIKKDINTLRKYTLPFRDAFNKMRVEADEFIQPTSVNYFQDVADHLQHLLASFEVSREMLKDLMDLQQSNRNNEMNRVMKTLTVVSAIFIPLTFLAGLYGMNFHYMPELDSPWGYPATLVVMVTVSVVMGVYMRIKKWI